MNHGAELGMLSASSRDLIQKYRQSHTTVPKMVKTKEEASVDDGEETPTSPVSADNV